MNFKIGEKIVCVDDSPIRTKQLVGIMKPVMLNEIYTVRSFKNTSDGIGITLTEVINPVVRFVDGVSEPVYAPERFRKMDYAFADKLLANIKEEVLNG